MDFRQFFLSGLHSFIRAFRRVGLFRASPLIALNRVRICLAMNILTHEELARHLGLSVCYLCHQGRTIRSFAFNSISIQ
ncbi:MAG: hypothetical protein LUQ36_03970, partial [Methanoregula sp.]|nr:hypothetical protein [Methanoregula sp.]